MASTTLDRRDEPSALIFIAVLAASVVGHAVLVNTMKLQSSSPTVRQSVEMAFFEAKAPEAPKPEVVKPVVVQKPVRVATTKPREDVPPPPARDSAEPTKDVPPVSGIEPDATTPPGTFAVLIGNFTIGPANKVVNEVKPYGGSKFAAPGSADSEPTVIGEVKVEYPPEAKLNDIDGAVRLRVTTDERGVVTSVVVINGPGYGLNEAARDALKRFTFKPATKAGEPVGYTFTYTYRFELN